MAKTIILNVLENSLTADLQQESEHNATVLTVDFTGCGVDGAVKWVDFIMSDGTQASTSLGTSIVPTYSLPNTLTKGGVLELQAYAKNGTSVTYKSKVFRVTIKRSLDVTTNTSDYDISVVESLQDAISDALIQVETIWEAYNTGELDGDDGLWGVSVNSIAFIGNDLVFTMSDSTTRTLVGAKLDLQGSKGDKGDNGDKGLDGKTIVSAGFVGDDLVFINNDSSTVTLVNARLALKGNTGASGISAYQVAVNNGFVGTESQWLLSLKGAKGDKGDTGSIDDLGGVIAGLDEKTTPVDADKFVISDSVSSNAEKRLTWASIKSTLKSYFDTLYNNYVHPTTAGNKHIPAGGSANQVLKYNSDGTAVWGTDNDTIYTHPNNHPASIITQDSSNRFVTDAEKVTWNDKATYHVFPVTIPSTSWTGSSAPYSKVINTVTGLLATDEPIIDLVFSGTYATDVTMRENWAKIYRGVTSADTITFYADSVPSADINIQLVVVR